MVSIELISPRRMLPLAVRSRLSLYLTASGIQFLAILKQHIGPDPDQQMGGVFHS